MGVVKHIFLALIIVQIAASLPVLRYQSPWTNKNVNDELKSFQLLLKLSPGKTHHPQTVSSENHLTCWTCPNSTDNEACNNWAPDVHCPRDKSVCKTSHRLNIVTMETESVNKVCAAADDCTMTHVGCHDVANTDVAVKECVSCCHGDYCNEEVPVDPLSALTLSTVTNVVSSGGSPLLAGINSLATLHGVVLAGACIVAVTNPLCLVVVSTCRVLLLMSWTV